MSEQEALQTEIPTQANDDESPPILTKLESKLPPSIFGTKEELFGKIWLIYTSVYWTSLVWIPIIVSLSFKPFDSLIMWCAGCIGVFSAFYTLLSGDYPSGSSKDKPNATDGIGRITTALLTIIIIADVSRLVFRTNILDDKTSLDIANSILLSLHLIQLFITSLFFYNKFYEFSKFTASTTFISMWVDIIYTAILSYILNELLLENNKSVDIVYFCGQLIGLIGWILPMVIIKNWGSSKYLIGVSLHVLILDLFKVLPIIITVLITQAYKDNILLKIDIFWKSGLLIRSIGFCVINLWRKEINESNDIEGENDPDKSAFKKVKSSRIATIIWILYVSIYYSILTLAASLAENEISTKIEYYLWFLAMIGVSGVWHAFLNGYNADSNGPGKSMVAFTCLIMSIDWLIRAFYALKLGELSWNDITVILLNSITILISMIFFYGYHLRNRYIFAWFMLFVEYIDILLMWIVIIILQNVLDVNNNGSCFDTKICNGYWIILCIKIIFYFIPIIAGYMSTEKAIHIHMLILNTLTDLPLVIIIIVSKGYQKHWFIFIDIVFKILILLKTYGYHGVINLALKKVEQEQFQSVNDADTNDDTNNDEERPMLSETQQ